MTKIILVGDIHMRDKPPVNCEEGYVEEILDILRYTAQLEKELDADAVVWAGDVFDFKQPGRTSHATIQRMQEVVQLFRNVWCVVGNHDISNDVLESTFEKQPLGVLLRSGLKELRGWHPDLPIFGVPWQQFWHHEDTPWEAFTEWRQKSIDLTKALAITHAPIYPPGLAEKQMFELVPTAGEKGLSHAMTGVGSLYYGHIHDDHGFFEVEGVHYGNVGAISRGSLNEHNIDRRVQVAVWSPEDGFTSHEVPHRPGSEVFKVSQVAESKEAKQNLDEFLGAVGSSTLTITSAASVVHDIQQMQHVEPPVRSAAVDIIQALS